MLFVNIARETAGVKITNKVSSNSSPPYQ